MHPRLTALVVMIAIARTVGVGYALLRYKTMRTFRRWASEGAEVSTSVSVEGLECTRVTVQLPSNSFGVDEVTLLEASADTQEVLVDKALDLDASGAEGDPYGVVSWPASRTVASRLLQFDASELRNWTVLELGSGTGLVSLTAALAGAPRVIASDFNPFALKMLEAAAPLQRTRIPHGVLSTLVFDITDSSKPLPPADLLLIADLLYSPVTGEAVARRIHEAVKRGTRVVIADSPLRPGRSRMLEVLSQLLGKDVQFRVVPGVAVGGVARHELISAPSSQSQPSFSSSLDMALLEL